MTPNARNEIQARAERWRHTCGFEQEELARTLISKDLPVLLHVVQQQQENHESERTRQQNAFQTMAEIAALREDQIIKLQQQLTELTQERDHWKRAVLTLENR